MNNAILSELLNDIEARIKTVAAEYYACLGEKRLCLRMINELNNSKSAEDTIAIAEDNHDRDSN